MRFTIEEPRPSPCKYDLVVDDGAAVVIIKCGNFAPNHETHSSNVGDVVVTWRNVYDNAGYKTFEELKEELKYSYNTFFIESTVSEWEKIVNLNLSPKTQLSPTNQTALKDYLRRRYNQTH